MWSTLPPTDALPRRADRGAAQEGEIRLRHLQREPFVRQRIRHLPGRQRPVLRRPRAARRRPYAGLRPALQGRRQAPTRRCSPSASARSRTPPSSTASTTATRASPRSSTLEGRHAHHGRASPQTEYRPLRRQRRAPSAAHGHAICPARDELYRLRHDPVLLALCQPLHAVRQHLRDRGHALDPERHRDDRRASRARPNGSSTAPRARAYTDGENHGTTQGPPLVNDPQPFYGSQFDTTAAAARQPAGNARRELQELQHRLEPDLRDRAADPRGARRDHDRPRKTSTPTSTCPTSSRTSPSSPRAAARRSPGAGTRKATTTSRPTGRATPPTTAT